VSVHALHNTGSHVPSWLGGTVGASFGFGGKLASFHATVRVFAIGCVVIGLLSEMLRSPRLSSFCPPGSHRLAPARPVPMVT